MYVVLLQNTECRQTKGTGSETEQAFECSRNDQPYAPIVPLLSSINRVRHVLAVACHHKGASQNPSELL
jgi:hypothetical protein